MTALPDATRLLLTLSACAALLAPIRTDALRLLDESDGLSLSPAPSPREAPRGPVLLAVAQPSSPSLDFDLLGDAPKPAVVAEDPSLRTRRTMLNLHQGVGLGLMGLQLASTVTGQLNYNDKFGVDNSGKYKLTHQIFTYSNLAAFAVTGSIALFAPSAKGPKTPGFGRTTLHKLGMGIATAGMITQGLLGIQTARREGYLDKERYGDAHLAVGYVTLAAMSVAVGAIVF